MTSFVRIENELKFLISFSNILKPIILLLFITFFSLSLYATYYAVYFYSLLIIINSYVIFLFKNNIFLLLFNIFCLFYTLSLIPYYFFNTNVAAWPDFNELKYYNSTLRIYGLFLIIPLFVNHRKYTYLASLSSIPSNKNILGFITFSIICALIIIFGLSGTNIFESGGYGLGDTSRSTLYEYFILFFLLTYYYSAKNKLQLAILISLGIIYILKSLLYGGRVEVIMFLLLCFLILTCDFKLKISPAIVIIGCLLFYYINQVFSGIRSNPFPLLEGKYSFYLNPYKYYSDSTSTFISSNEGDVFQASVRLIGLMENGLLDYFTRFKAFIGFIFSIVVPSSWLPEEASLITYKKDIYNSGGGGLIAVYFYCFFGWLGPVIISAYILWSSRFTTIYKSVYLKLYFLMIFSTFPRWFAYNPIILFKLCLWIIPIAFFSNLIFSCRLKSLKHDF